MLKKKENIISDNIIKIVNPNDIKTIIDDSNKKGMTAIYYKNSNVIVIGKDIQEVSKLIYEHEKK